MHRSYRTRCGVFLQAKRKKLIANDQFELAGYIRKAIGSVGSGKESAGRPGPKQAGPESSSPMQAYVGHKPGPLICLGCATCTSNTLWQL